MKMKLILIAAEQRGEFFRSYVENRAAMNKLLYLGLS